MKTNILMLLILIICITHTGVGQNTMTAGPKGSVVKGRLMYSENNYTEVITAGYIFALSADKKQILSYTKPAKGTQTTGGGAWELSGLPMTGKILLIGYASKVHRLCWMQELVLDGKKYYNLGDNHASIPTPKQTPATQAANYDPVFNVLRMLLTIGWVIDISQKGDKLEQIDALTDQLERYRIEKEGQSGNSSSNTNFSYPVKVRFVKTIMPRVKFDTVFYMNENKVQIVFEPLDIVQYKLWTEIHLTINYKEFDLYDAPHGPGLDQVGMWDVNVINDFSDIIKLNNNNYPAKMTTKVLNKYQGTDAAKVEVNIQILQKPKEIKEIKAQYVSTEVGDLAHIIFKDVLSNKKYDFHVSFPEYNYIDKHESVLKNQTSTINYVSVRVDIGKEMGWNRSEMADVLMITNIRNPKLKDPLKKIKSREEIIHDEQQKIADSIAEDANRRRLLDEQNSRRK